MVSEVGCGHGRGRFLGICEMCVALGICVLVDARRLVNDFDCMIRGLDAHVPHVGLDRPFLVVCRLLFVVVALLNLFVVVGLLNLFGEVVLQSRFVVVYLESAHEVHGYRLRHRHRHCLLYTSPSPRD